MEECVKRLEREPSEIAQADSRNARALILTHSASIAGTGGADKSLLYNIRFCPVRFL